MYKRQRRDIEDGIDSTAKKMTLCQLYAKQNAQRANVKKSTIKQREQLMRLLKEDKLGARSIDTIKPSEMCIRDRYRIFRESIFRTDLTFFLYYKVLESITGG